MGLDDAGQLGANALWFKIRMIELAAFVLD
jgi:hypothetical protein